LLIDKFRRYVAYQKLLKSANVLLSYLKITPAQF